MNFTRRTIVYHLNFTYSLRCTILTAATCCATWGEVGVDCHVAGHVPHLNRHRDAYGGFEDDDDIGDDDDEIANPKACDEVEHSNFAAHTAHLKDSLSLSLTRKQPAAGEGRDSGRQQSDPAHEPQGNPPALLQHFPAVEDNFEIILLFWIRLRHLGKVVVKCPNSCPFSPRPCFLDDHHNIYCPW